MRRSISSGTARRVVAAATLSLLALLVLAMPALAGVAWCRVDPTVNLNGNRVQIWVAVPEEYASKVSGPVQVQIDAPAVVSRQLLATDSGFHGYGERVTFTTNNGTLMPGGAFWATIVVQVPMNGFYQQVPVQVEVVKPDGSRQTLTGSQYNVNGTFVVTPAN